MDEWTAMVAGAVVGGVATGVVTWWVGHALESRKARVADGRAVAAKLHDLELRMSKVETLIGHYLELFTGLRDPGPAPRRKVKP